MLLGFPKADGTRRDSLKRSWDSLKKKNAIQDFQLKKLPHLIQKCPQVRVRFHDQVSFGVPGTFPDVNEANYDPVSEKIV